MENNISEQPENLGSEDRIAEQPLSDSQVSGQEREGSTLGKFKNVDELKKAYDNLESEFTKRSQLLKRYQAEEKTPEPIQSSEKTRESIPSSENTSVREEAPMREEAMQEDANSAHDKASEAPWEKSNWQESVAEFFGSNPEAREHSKEIAKVLAEDKTVALSPSPLYAAWSKVAVSRFKDPGELVYDDEFVSKYVLNNEDIKRKIIREYVAGVSSGKKMPAVIAEGKGADGLASKSTKPATVHEAGELLKKIFKN